MFWLKNIKLFDLEVSLLQPSTFLTAGFFFLNVDEYILFMMTSKMQVQLLNAFLFLLTLNVIPQTLHPMALTHRMSPHPPYEEIKSFSVLSLPPFEKSLPRY